MTSSYRMPFHLLPFPEGLEYLRHRGRSVTRRRNSPRVGAIPSPSPPATISHHAVSTFRATMVEMLAEASHGLRELERIAPKGRCKVELLEASRLALSEIADSIRRDIRAMVNGLDGTPEHGSVNVNGATAPTVEALGDWALIHLARLDELLERIRFEEPRSLLLSIVGSIAAEISRSWSAAHDHLETALRAAE